ncbi:MAG: hypothetical protein ABI988_04070, partial [Nitrospirota bacterium]
MTSHSPNTDILPPTSRALLNVVTQFSAKLGTLTDPTTLGDRIIQELCRTVATTHGALYLLDREHECYRPVSMVGPAAPTLMPPTLAMDHPLPHHLLTSNGIIREDDSTIDLPEPDSGSSAREAMETFQATHIVPHLMKSRLIAFSLLGAAIPPAQEQTLTRSMLSTLAQIATNALGSMLQHQDLLRSHTLMQRTNRLKSLETIAGG